MPARNCSRSSWPGNWAATWRTNGYSAGVMFPRSEAEAADAHELVDLCLGDRAPYGLIEFFTRAASVA